jgi:hypothetical protein
MTAQAMRTITMTRAALLALLVLSISASAADPSAATRPTKPIAQYTNDELIDRLTEITNEQFSLRTNIIAGDPLLQGLLRQQQPALAPAKAQEELLRRGVSAMPQLLAHLDDARKTKSVINGMFSGITYSAEYDWNRRSETMRPTGVVSNALLHFQNRNLKIVGQPKDNEYTVTVGDLCYNLIGDIVNRSYECVRYQPTAIVIVNSPVLCPDLCNAVRRQWKGLTPEKHRASLVTDVVTPDRPERDHSGIIRLLKYYPDAAPAAIRKSLIMPVYNFETLRELVSELYATPEPATRQKMIDQFIARNPGPSRDALILELWGDRFLEIGQEIRANEKLKAAPRDILKSLIKTFDEDYPPLIDPALHADPAGFISAISEFPSAEIDQIVWETFLKYSTNHGDSWNDADRIANAALIRLAHKGHNAELIAYCQRRRDELKPKDQSDRDVADLDKLIASLSKSPPAPPAP